MKYEVTKSFAGLKLVGNKGETVDISDKSLAADLLQAGYIKPKEKAVKSNENKRVNNRKRR